MTSSVLVKGLGTILPQTLLYLSLALFSADVICARLESLGHLPCPWSSFSKHWFAWGESWPCSGTCLLKGFIQEFEIFCKEAGVAVYLWETILSPNLAPKLFSVSWNTFQRISGKPTSCGIFFYLWFTTCSHNHEEIASCLLAFRPQFKSWVCPEQLHAFRYITWYFWFLKNFA